MRVVYLEPDPGGPPPHPAHPFRTGEAGFVWVDESGNLETEARFELTANSTHALLGHGVVDALNALPLDGRLGEGLEVVIAPGVLEAARALFYEADRKTYGRVWEFVAGYEEGPVPVEYRVRVDNREYQSTLSRLQFLMTTASHEGRAAWIRI